MATTVRCLPYPTLMLQANASDLSPRSARSRDASTGCRFGRGLDADRVRCSQRSRLVPSRVIQAGSSSSGLQRGRGGGGRDHLQRACHLPCARERHVRQQNDHRCASQRPILVLVNHVYRRKALPFLAKIRNKQNTIEVALFATIAVGPHRPDGN